MIPRSGWKAERYTEADIELLEKLEGDFGEFIFKPGRKFAFRPPKTIVIGPSEPFLGLLTFHEVSHAILGHKTFKTGVGRLKMEMAAWEKARELADQYGIAYNEEVIQGELDTYRDWLHQKSRCPECGLTRFETPDGVYHCPRCENF